jgi:5-methylcytosine-specific restriction protein B
MSRFHPSWDIEAILDAASSWKDIALLGDGAMFTHGQLWTDENLNALQKHYVENLDEGEGDFFSKLKGQIEPAPASAKQLMAEITWFMLLGPSNIGMDNKRESVETIWSWSGAPFPNDSIYFADAVLRGIGSAGAAYNMHRWRELVFFIRFLRAFRELSLDERKRLLADGWGLAEWMQSLPECDARQIRHMILYLLFPDDFEQMFGRSDRRNLILSFTDIPKPKVFALSAIEMDRELLKVRKEQEELLGTKELNFYASPLKEKWEKQRRPTTPPVSEPTEFDKKTEGVRAQNVLQALQQIDQESYPPDARSSTYDLIHNSKRYPPKYVLSLAVKIATGEEFPRSFFSGGEDSRAFRLLRDLGFFIERKYFVRELLQKFLKQANEGTSLVVSDYPKRYRDLDVNVSFGKGNFAKIPWISYTGYGQSTSAGIYPVVLYFKSDEVLVVAYGISETNRPEAHWEDLGAAESVGKYLESNFDVSADRYGSSIVHKGFKISEEVDDAGIEKALDEVIGAYHKQFSDQPVEAEPLPRKAYTAEDALKDLLIEEQKFAEILQLLKEKKNLILQGAPGVGKTFACKRLAFTLIGEKADDRVGMVQFHQSYSYEDFIQGYRPSAQGFRLKDGVFYEFCDLARDDPGNNYVFIIDELNRGNLSKVFGELMLLIETDKRGPEWAIPLAYAEEDSPKFYIPENLYLIGLMNTADRSLAMVDYALRRRFAFATLTPGFETDQFFDYMVDREAEPELINEIVKRMVILNRKIADDTTNLGPGFCVGHSFFCSVPDGVALNWGWYERVVKSEIAPLLREYYFDAQSQADSLIEGLLRKS